ncbi:MAG: hypothetical protein HRU19_30585 [Pseudobacteriovorax sp.]|nr:hypothetical protein [Pseudobacteriovorax sp.]
MKIALSTLAVASLFAVSCGSSGGSDDEPTINPGGRIPGPGGNLNGNTDDIAFADSDCGLHVWSKGLTFEGFSRRSTLQDDGTWSESAFTLSSEKSRVIAGSRTSGPVSNNPDCQVLESAIGSAGVEWTSDDPLLVGFDKKDQINKGDIAAYGIDFDFTSDEDLPFETVDEVEAYLAGDQEPIAVANVSAELSFSTGAISSSVSLVESTDKVTLQCAKPFTYEVRSFESEFQDGRLCKYAEETDKYSCYEAKVVYTADTCVFTAVDAKMYHPAGGTLEFDLSGVFYQTKTDDGETIYKVSVNSVKL